MSTDVGYSKLACETTAGIRLICLEFCAAFVSSDHMRDTQKEDGGKRQTVALRRRDYETLTAERSSRYRLKRQVTGMSQPEPRQV